MATHKLLLLPGDGIGPEVMAEVKRSSRSSIKKARTNSRPKKRWSAAAPMTPRQSHHRRDHGESERRRRGDLRRGRRAEMGQGALRRAAGGRPAAAAQGSRCCSPISARRSAIRRWPTASSLKRELVDGLDIIILRELTGGVYFGEPKTITDLGNGQKRAIDTQVYDTYEIERISRVAFELARKRRNKVTSMEKRNVMKTGVLWNEVVTRCTRASSRTCSSSTCWPMPAACSWCAIRSSSTSSSPTICSATCCPTSRRC